MRAFLKFGAFAVTTALLGAVLVACSPMSTMALGSTGSSVASGMSCFLTNANPSKSADFGGLSLAGCPVPTRIVKSWRAYLSSPGAGSAIHARDRIGRGPWQNAKGVKVASSVEDLHSANNQLSKVNSLTEKGEVIAGRGDAVNMHDILSGSTADGRLDTSAADTTCGGWSKSGEGSAIVGHHERSGLNELAPAKSWNASHGTRGCSMDALKATGGG